MRRLGHDEWLKLISEYEANPIPHKEFAAKHEVSLATFQFRLYKTRKTILRSRNSDSPPAFLPVEVVASPAPKALRGEAVSDRSPTP
jgi:hypothetical protein